MAYVLPVRRGLASIGVPLNGNNRIDIYDASAAAHEIVNSPDTTPALGGQFPVYDANGALWTIRYTNISGPGTIIEEFIGLTPGDAVQGGWTR